jgi:hypothetical protein
VTVEEIRTETGEEEAETPDDVNSIPLADAPTADSDDDDDEDEEESAHSDDSEDEEERD